MNVQECIRRLESAFPEGILTDGHVNPSDSREIRFEAAGEGMQAVARHVHRTMGLPLAMLFASDERSRCDAFAVYYVFSDREAGRLLTFRTAVPPESSEICSISDDVPAAALYEREIQDLFGIRMSGHPDPRRMILHGYWPAGEYPLREDFDAARRPARAQAEEPFRRVEGEGVFEIPVGPVHAGIIEPGHFRFSVAGEPIIHLEARLYYVHKGIEKLCAGKSVEQGLYVSERISGDETFANSLAYCQAVEAIAGVPVPERALFTRVVFAELERLTSHLGDLAGVCLDTGYGFAVSQFRKMRGWAYQLADELCGRRFLRSVNRLGGVHRDFLAGREESVARQIERFRRELGDTVEMVLANSMFADRTENTGILDRETASDLHAVGPAARASGIPADTRKDFPYAAYGALEFQVPPGGLGDVDSRIRVKMAECVSSLGLMDEALRRLPPGGVYEPIGSVPAGASAFGLVESPRGETVHWVMTGGNGTLSRYKIRTASFCNWPALTQAVRGNIVPDFPLINKSFNLSYAGNDL